MEAHKPPQRDKMLYVVLLALVAGSLSMPTTPDVTVFFKQAFDVLDKDHNGHLAVDEFTDVFKDYDKNGDGRLTLHEYMHASKLDKFMAKEVYKFVDTDHDGALDKSDMNRIYKDYDTNGDGVITLKEFIAEYSKIYQMIMKDLPAGYTFQILIPTGGTV